MKLSRAARALRLAAAALIAAAMLVAPASAAPADIIDLTIDFAKLMTLDRPATTIVIGNPGIFDASIGNDKTIVLTGKTAGTTNMIILDADGKEITNAVVRVSSDIRRLTTVFKGSNRQTFSCSPTCEQVISVGDSSDAFGNAQSQIQARQVFSGTD